jgi:HAD superfamily 5'-nucleotidase-like hydrolase
VTNHLPTPSAILSSDGDPAIPAHASSPGSTPVQSGHAVHVPLPPPSQTQPAHPPVGPTQLTLPMPDLVFTPQSWAISREQRVFVNRNLRLSEVDWVGFDMDYTLAIYNQPEMDGLQIQATLPRLVARGYPEFLRDLRYDISFPIRGLLIDKKLGHVLKMDRYKVVGKAWHGMRELSRAEITTSYQQLKIRLTSDRYHWVDTLYALSEVTMYAAIIEALEQRGIQVDFARLFADIRECIDEAHRDGTVLEAVANDYPRFVLKDPDLAPTLHRWRSAGKRLFLLTNSRWSYTDRMMTYLLGDERPEYPSWRHYFDAIVAAASKPAFFQERRPLMEREGEVLRPASDHLERGKVYEGGNLHDLERLLGITGDRVLYVGDHIYGDILRSKKESAWRTAMIIQEMNAEVVAHTQGEQDIHVLRELEERRQKAEDELRFVQLRYKLLTKQIETYQADRSRGIVAVQVLENERNRWKKHLEGVRGLLRTLEAQIIELEGKIDRRFHTYWGSLLKEGNETSSFGDQVEQYACLYTSKVSNFLAYSPLQNYRSPRDLMAHEL